MKRKFNENEFISKPLFYQHFGKTLINKKPLENDDEMKKEEKHEEIVMSIQYWKKSIMI